jgi:hypothetical protein
MINLNSIYAKIANVEVALDALTGIGADTDALIVSVAAIKTELDTLVATIGATGSEYPNTDLVAKIDTIEEHIHSTALVYPVLAAPVTLTTAAQAWTFGSYIEIVPINTITSTFDLHFAMVGNISNNGDYVLSIAKGAISSEVLIAQTAFTRTTNQDRGSYFPVITSIQAANTRIVGRLASSVAGATTATVKLMYHIY